MKYKKYKQGTAGVIPMPAEMPYDDSKETAIQGLAGAGLGAGLTALGIPAPLAQMVGQGASGLLLGDEFMGMKGLDLLGAGKRADEKHMDFMQRKNNAYAQNLHMGYVDPMMTAANGLITTQAEPIEVEGGEIVMDGSFRIKADFEGGAKHEEGGIKYQAAEGDIIFPAKMRKQVMDAYKSNDLLKLRTLQKQLPLDTGQKTFDDGVQGLRNRQYGQYKFKSKYPQQSMSVDPYAQAAQFLRGRSEGGVDPMFMPANGVVDQRYIVDPSAPVSNSYYGGLIKDEMGIGIQPYGGLSAKGFNPMKLGAPEEEPLPGPYAPRYRDVESTVPVPFVNAGDKVVTKEEILPNGQGLTPGYSSRLGGAMANMPSILTPQAMMKDSVITGGLGGQPIGKDRKGLKDIAEASQNFVNNNRGTLNTLASYAPMAYNFVNFFSNEAFEEQPNQLQPKYLQYEDRSEPLRNQARQMRDMGMQTAANVSGGNIGNFRANAAQAQANTMQQLRQIDAAESGRSDQINAMNSQIANQYIPMQLQENLRAQMATMQNQARHKEFFTTGLEQLSQGVQMDMYNNEKKRLVNEQMANQRNADQIRLNALEQSGAVRMKRDANGNPTGEMEYDPEFIMQMIQSGMDPIYFTQAGLTMWQTKQKAKGTVEDVSNVGAK